MEITAQELCDILKGELSGDGTSIVSKFSPIEVADERSLTFISNPKYHPYLYTTKAAIVLVEKGFQPEKEVKPTLIGVDDVYSTLSSLLDKFNNVAKHKSGVEQPHYVGEGVALGAGHYIGAFSYIGNNCQIGENVKIYPHTYIGENVKISDNTVIYPGAKIFSNCQIGKQCIIHSGAVIGSDGFGFAPQKDGSYKKIPQTGKVVLEDHVEIGANTTIDRATIEATVIKSGVKLDNLIQIAHNVEIGNNSVIAAQSGVSGSTKLGHNCVIGGQVGIAGHITIAKGTQVGAQSGIHSNISKPDTKWFGSPVSEYKTGLRASILLKNLPNIYERLKKVENHIRKPK